MCHGHFHESCDIKVQSLKWTNKIHLRVKNNILSSQNCLDTSNLSCGFADNFTASRIKACREVITGYKPVCWMHMCLRLLLYGCCKNNIELCKSAEWMWFYTFEKALIMLCKAQAGGQSHLPRFLSAGADPLAPLLTFTTFRSCSWAGKSCISGSSALMTSWLHASVAFVETWSSNLQTMR